MRFYLVGVIFLFTPLYANAAVIINEIAWMGTATSANDEWIELYNNGDTSVTLDGWSLSDGVNLNIPLTGIIAGGQYAVLERTDDDSAPGTAFLIYTGALSNTGATLTLKRSGGDIADQVAGGEDWSNVGGDNTTKETAQYSPQGWLTARATPGETNATTASTPPEDDVDADEDEKAQTTSNIEKSKPSPRMTLELPDVELSLELTTPRYVYVNQPVSFSVTPSGLGEVIMDSLIYEWNFGDLNVGHGQDAKHSYSHPGEYVLTVRAHYARHEQTAREIIKVLPVTFTLGRTENGDISLHNLAQYEVNLSGYQLEAAGPFKFPPRTFLLPKATIVIAKEKVGAHNQSPVVLRDQSGAVVARLTTPATLNTSPDLVTEPIPEVARTQSAPGPALVSATPQSNFAFKVNASEASLVNENGVAKGSTTISLPTGNNLTAAAGETTIPSAAWPYLGLMALLFMGIVGVYASGKN